MVGSDILSRQLAHLVTEQPIIAQAYKSSIGLFNISRRNGDTASFGKQDGVCGWFCRSNNSALRSHRFQNRHGETCSAPTCIEENVAEAEKRNNFWRRNFSPHSA